MAWKLRVVWSVFFVIWNLFLVSANAQEFTASVDRNQVQAGERFEITFMLSGSSGGRNFRPPAWNDFLVLSGPNQSTNMQFINGSMLSSVSYSYVLQARAEGKFVIGPATIEVSGKQMQTQPITMQVTKGAPPPKQTQKGNQQSNQADQNTDVGRQIGDNLFLKATVDKSRVYQGEQITATYKIYTRVNVVNYAITKVPALTGFWGEDLDVPKQIQLTNEVVNGKQYRVGVLKSVALFPQRSGSLSLDPMEVECTVQLQVRRNTNNLFDQFFNDPFFGNVTNVNYKVRNEPVKITVLPLPSANVPQGFSGAVGSYSMESWLDKNATKTNEPVTLKVKISGRGNLKLIETPAVNVPPDFERYDPKISDNISHQENKVAGSRTYEFLLLPRHPGEQKIASFPFSYFDIERKAYVTLKSPEFSVNVERGSEIASTSAAGISKEDVKLLGEDIRFIKSENISLQRRGERFVGSFAFYASSFSPILSFIGFVLYMRKREKVLGDVVGLRNRRARKVAQKRLTVAQKFLETKKKVNDSTLREEFYTEVSRALWGFVADKLGLPVAELSLEVVCASLEAHSVPPEIVAKLSSTIEQCEFARFAPSSDSQGMESMYKEAIELISKIEERVK